MDCNANGSDKCTSSGHTNDDHLFEDILHGRVVVFLDDVIIYSIIVEEYFKFLEKVFAYLYKHAFYCKVKKCSFLRKTTTF